MNSIIKSISLTIGAILLVFTSFAQTAKTFSSLKYDKVMIYDYSGYGLFIVDQYGRLAKTVTKRAVLNEAEINKLSKSLDSKNSYGAGIGACFDPNFGIVYYNKAKVVASVSICFGCNRLESSIDIEGHQQGHGKGKDAYYMLDGLRNPFRLFLRTLMIRHKFPDQVGSDLSYDK